MAPSPQSCIHKVSKLSKNKLKLKLKNTPKPRSFVGTQVTGWIQALACHLGNASHESSLKTVACAFQHHLTPLLGKGPRSLCKQECDGLYLLHYHHWYSFSIVFQQCFGPRSQCRHCYPPWTILLSRCVFYSPPRSTALWGWWQVLLTQWLKSLANVV